MGTISQGARILAGVVCAGSLLVCPVGSSADETRSGHGGDAMSGDQAADAHAHHHQMLQASPTVGRSTASYRTPDITLLSADGARVNFARELDGHGRPVLLDFIYTSCTTICPVLSGIFAEVQKRLGRDAAKVKMVSVSIDPEQDTPARLTEYARRYDAGAQWSFYTGSAEASIAVQRAFDVYRGDKMNHVPVTLFRPAPGQPWVRLDGFATADMLLDYVRPQVAQR